MLADLQMRAAILSAGVRGAEVCAIGRSPHWLAAISGWAAYSQRTKAISAARTAATSAKIMTKGSRSRLIIGLSFAA